MHELTLEIASPHIVAAHPAVHLTLYANFSIALPVLLCLRPDRADALSDDARLTSDVCLSRTIGPKSRTEV